MIDVVGTDEFAAWYKSLSDADAEVVTQAVTVLESVGIDQPHVAPMSGWDALSAGARLRGLRAAPGTKLPLYELSVRGGSLRVIFALEGDDHAVLVYGYSEDELGTNTAARLPAMAHSVLAAKIYWLYREGQPKKA